MIKIPREQVDTICLAIRGYQMGQIYSEYSKESAQGLSDHFNGIPKVIFLNDVEGMAQSIVYHHSDSIN